MYAERCPLKENSWTISRVLCLDSEETRCPSFIWVRCHQRTLSFYPLMWVKNSRTSRPDDTSLRELSTSEVHSPYVTTRLVGSYPTFSPLPPLSLPLPTNWFATVSLGTGGSFLLHVFALTNDFPLRSGMLYVARTFLVCHKSKSDGLPNC